MTKRKGVKKTKRKARKSKTGTGKKPKIPAEIPKAIRRRIEEVAEAEPVSEEDIRVERPTPRDPVVRVKGRVVGAWVEV